VLVAAPPWNLRLSRFGIKWPSCGGNAQVGFGAFLRRPAPMGVAISDLAAGLARDGAGEAGNRGPVASQGLSALLAVAIKIAPDWSAEDEHRDSAT
jgi:hypothetical protein